MARKKSYPRFPGLKPHKFKTDDSHFSSGKPDREERKEWKYWHKGYKEKDYFKAYLIEVNNIPKCNDDYVIRHWQKHGDRASFNLLICANLKTVVKIAYRIADKYGFKPSYNLIRDRKKARQGYEVVVADLICAGTEGLLDAPKRFRLDAGASFKTAASKSIEKEIRAEARRLRQAVKVPEDKNLPWYSSLTSYDDYVNEYQGETDVAVDGFAYQPEDAAINADSADATPPGQEFNRTTRDFACLADLDRAANSLKDKRERDIFRARYIAGKTLKAIASKYRTGFQRVSKIARAARDKILATDFTIENIDLRATLPQWFAYVEWLDDLQRHNDVELIRTRDRLARLWTPGDERFGLPLPLETINRLALWRLAEFDREDINDPGWNRRLIDHLKIPDKKERWRKRKSDAPGLWGPLIPFWHPPEEGSDRIVPIYSVTPPWLGPVISAYWTTRSIYPARIHVEAKPQWTSPNRDWMLWPDLQKKYPTPRSGWREALRPGDWRIAYRQKIEDEFWSNYQLLSPLKEAA